MTEGEPQLKYQETRLVDCHDLDKFVANQLVDAPITWKALDTSSDGYHNGAMRAVDVKLGDEIEDDLDQDFYRWLSGEGPFYTPEEGYYQNWSPDVQHILQWLCNIGKIPEGKYVVEMWW